MQQEQLEQLKYPIGKYQKPDKITTDTVKTWIEEIETFPDRLKAETKNLVRTDLEARYRDGGWTIRQIIHHCADSHMNSFMRFKLALTENKPTIKPYLEDKWAMLPDTISAPVNTSLLLLDGLHQRWTILLKSLSPSDLQKSFIHPEKKKEMKLDEVIGLYAWHCSHHLEHIRVAKRNLPKK